MTSALRETLDHAKYCKGAVEAITALLPESDEAVEELLHELVGLGDHLGLNLTLNAALDAGRRVDARICITGLSMLYDFVRIGTYAWKLQGDVASAILQGCHAIRLPPVTQVGALLVAELWLSEKHSLPAPPELISEARTLCRIKGLDTESLSLLTVLTLRVQDEAMLSIFRRNYPHVLNEDVISGLPEFIEGARHTFAQPVIEMIPAQPASLMPVGRTQRRAVEKHQRNEACPCGSGKKYKRCCAERDRERLEFSTEVAGKTAAELRAQPAIGLTAARLQEMPIFELSRVAITEVPHQLHSTYFRCLLRGRLHDRVAEFIEASAEWPPEAEVAWGFAMHLALVDQHLGLAQRLIAAHEEHAPITKSRPGLPLLLAKDQPAEHARIIETIAQGLLHATAPDDLANYATDLLYSPYPALGIAVTRSILPLLPNRYAILLLSDMLHIRDKLNLPPEDPYEDIVEKQLTEAAHDEGKDATALRKARQKLETKAHEVRHLREEIQRQRSELERREKLQTKAQSAPQTQPTAAQAADASEVREMRRKLQNVQASLTERSAERTELRHALEKAQQDLAALRDRQPPAPAPSHDDEDQHYLPEAPIGNQPLRTIHFPPKFHDTLETHPRAASRAALTLLGRLAAGEPEAYAGVVQLKAVHGILRQRIGSDHRLLFRLHPHHLEVIDLINRRDLDRRIKSLRG